jgi:hypothetical protein
VDHLRLPAGARLDEPAVGTNVVPFSPVLTTALRCNTAAMFLGAADSARVRATAWSVGASIPPVRWQPGWPHVRPLPVFRRHHALRLLCWLAVRCRVRVSTQ